MSALVFGLLEIGDKKSEKNEVKMQVMKTMLKISIWLNLVLLGGLVYSVLHQSKTEIAITRTIIAETALSAKVATNSPSALAAQTEWTQPFHWSRLESTNDYRRYVANLRAIGCPEATVQDIVNGDARRAFAFKRRELGLDGSGSGSWSRLRESQLTATLLGENTLVEESSVPAHSAENREQPASGAKIAQEHVSMGMQPAELPWRGGKVVEPIYPLAFRKVNQEALGFGGREQAAIEQVQQQFVADVGGASQNPSDPAYLARWQSAQVKADDTLRGLLGSQAYMAYQQQQYYAWYQPQVLAADSEGRVLTINPALFSQEK